MKVKGTDQVNLKAHQKNEKNGMGSYPFEFASEGD